MTLKMTSVTKEVEEHEIEMNEACSDFEINKIKVKLTDSVENLNTKETDTIAQLEPVENCLESLKTINEGQRNILGINMENTVNPKPTINMLEQPRIRDDGKQSILDANLDTNRIVIKEEPMNERDYDMPIFKTKSHASPKTAEITDNCPEPPRIVAEGGQSILYENVASTSNSTTIEVTESIPDLNKILEYPTIPHQSEENILETNRLVVKEEPVSDEMNCDTSLSITPNSNIIPNEQVFNTPLETTTVVVKEEPVSEEMNCDVPVSLSSSHSTVIENEQVSDVKSNTTNNINEKDNSNNLQLDESLENLDLDAYLDDLITPVVPTRPQLRVKAEFALQKSPQREPSPKNDFLGETSGIVVKTEILQPPPPPIFSSNSNSDFIAQGIATPKLSLVAINRLRVKSEFSCFPATSTNNQNFINDILVNEEQNREEGQASSETSEDEHIPDDFFDDLLRDKLQERIEEAQNNDLEEKYSDRLKELRRLQKEMKRAEQKSETRRRSHKKEKKSKKKSRKRARSRSSSPRSKTKAPKFQHLSGVDRKSLPTLEPMASSSNYVYREREGDFFRVYSGSEIKSEFPPSNLEETAEESQSLAEQVGEIETVLTPKQKRERAIRRAKTLLNNLKTTAGKSYTTFSSFPFVSTVRKLQTEKHENRSPLNALTNVRYNFNSPATSVNVRKYGLVALPPATAKLAKLIGCDAQFIHNKLQTMRTVSKLRDYRLEPRAEAEAEIEEEEELLKTNSPGLFSSVTTQTDVCQLDTPMTSKGYEVGVQAKPSVKSIACQTLETQTPTDYIRKSDDTPLIKLLSDLNENQLMAMHAFAELIKEPNANGSAMDIYKIQMKISDIYKISQMPSAIATAKNPIGNNYATKPTTKQSKLHVKNVEDAAGQKVSGNYARTNTGVHNRYPAAYGRPSRSEDGHYYSGSSNYLPSARPHNPAYNNEAPSSTIKRFGRGAARR